jgi:signal transduction histidine kinase
MDSAARVRGSRAPALAGLLGSLGEGATPAGLGELLDSLPIAVAVMDGDGEALRFAYLNSHAQQLTSTDTDEALGQPLEHVLSGPEEVLEAVGDARQNGGPRRVRYRAAEGRLWDFEAVRLQRGPTGTTRLLATWQAVSEPGAGGTLPGAARREASSNGAADQANAAVDAAIEVGGSLDPARVLEWMLRRTADDAEADLVVLMRLEEDELVPEVGFDRSAGAATPGDHIKLSADVASRRTFELGHPVLRSPEPLASDPETSPRLRELRHSARVPLLVPGEPSALLLLLGRRRGNPFKPEDAALLEAVGRHAAVAIRNARLYERAQSTARRLQVGVDVALEVATRLEPEEVVDRILHRALEAVEAERAMLGRMGEGLKCTILGSVDEGGDPAPIGMTVSLESQEPAVQAIRSGRPAQGRIDYEEIGMRPLKWALVIPLVVSGELIALLGVSRDRGQFDEEEIAVLHQIGAVAALALRNATLFQTLRDASRVRSQFLNMAAHELRTPLSVIAGYVSMLADGTLGEGPAAWRPPLDVMVEKTRELAHLIDDILLAGRLESGVARTTGRSMDLGEPLREAVQRAAARAELIDAMVELQAPRSPVPVSVDPDHIARILDNLVNNAFNYSPEPPRVKVTLEAIGDAALLRVEDSGRGIGREHRERIFQQFYRVDDPTDAYPPGTGLGLFISRALAERYGGSLELEWSEEGVGSRFLLRLPLTVPAERASAAS